MPEPLPKRRRQQHSPSPRVGLDGDAEDDYEPYVPVAQRRQAKLAVFAARGSNINNQRSTTNQESDAAPHVDEEEERRRERERNERTLLMEAQEVHRKKAVEGTSDSFSSHWVF